MGWKGTLRSINATIKAAERDAKRRQRELERKRKEFERATELQQAAYEVEVFENYTERLISIHKEYSREIDWEKIAASHPPKKPSNSNKREIKAKVVLENYKPTLTDKILNKAVSKRKELTDNIVKAKFEDKREYQKTLKQYQQNYSNWESSCALAKKILSGDKEAYTEAIKEINPFSEISDIGSGISFSYDKERIIETTISVHGEKVIPKEIKSLLKSGKVSVKKMPIGRFYEIYQDYICSCLFRIVNELFALLPIEIVIATAFDEILNTSTGHLEEQPILSVIAPRKTIKSLNMDKIDPSDALSNFVHNMNFKKTKGFSIVEQLKSSDIKL